MCNIRTDQLTTAGSTEKVFPRALCAEDVRALSAIENWRGALAILFQWSVIAAVAFAAIWSMAGVCAGRRCNRDSPARIGDPSA